MLTAGCTGCWSGRPGLTPLWANTRSPMMRQWSDCYMLPKEFLRWIAFASFVSFWNLNFARRELIGMLLVIVFAASYKYYRPLPFAFIAFVRLRLESWLGRFDCCAFARSPASFWADLEICCLVLCFGKWSEQRQSVVGWRIGTGWRRRCPLNY